MAPRRAWFDEHKLLPDERIVRRGPARLRSDGPPRWWEGELVLTSDRLFFLPHVPNPLVGDAAFWLDDLTAAEPAGRNRLRAGAGGASAVFQLLGVPASPFGLTGLRARAWLRDVASLRPGARPRLLFGDGPHRAAG